jgi:hypothetical protein
MKPQTRAILTLLEQHPEGITPLDALDEVGSFRLGARISDLKADGIEIRALQATDSHGHRYARYFLVEQPLQMAAGF